MRIEVLEEAECEPWDRYVMQSNNATAYHLIGWKDVIEKSFGHKTYYLFAREQEKIVGVLPLVCMKSLFFGRFVVSLPFLNYAGICAESLHIKKALLERGVRVAEAEKADHIELRHTKKHDLGLPAKENKVAMILELPPSSEVLWKAFKPKLRSQIRRAKREEIEVEFGGIELVDDFYKVFAINMRDLGTPVYSKSFFVNILNKFPEASRIGTVFYKKKPVASGFLFGFKGKVEIPWASSLRKYNRLAPNMLLYWQVLKYACGNGYTQFDFGRCTLNSTTYNFKAQWGAKPVQLYWHYWLSSRQALPEINPSNPKYNLAVQMWKRMPVYLTNLIGPYIVKAVP